MTNSLFINNNNYVKIAIESLVHFNGKYKNKTTLTL